MAPPPDPPAPATHVGVGYKIGNGVGFEGADLILSPAAHIAVDLQVNHFSASTGNRKAYGYAVAPALQLYLRPAGVSTPYLSVGYVYATLKLDDITASVQGGFVNAGYEWKWHNGLAILVGGGILVTSDATATNGVETISVSGDWNLNIEAGLRYMIF